MQALQQLMRDNADPSNTRYRMLTFDEVSEIVEWGNCQHAIACMRETYRRRRARAEHESLEPRAGKPVDK